MRPLEQMSDDARFYLHSAQQTVEGAPLLAEYNPYADKYAYNTAVGPLYPAFIVLFLSSLPETVALVGVRVVQVLLDTVSVWLVYHIARRLFNRQAGIVAMAAMALDVRFALQAPDPTTETLYIALSVAGFYLYIAALESRRLRGFISSGVVFGLATLTRPVPILFPAALAIHAVLAGEQRRRLLKGVAFLAVTQWIVVMPWVVRNAIVTGGEFIPVVNTAASNFWLGSTGDGTYHGHEQFFEAREQEVDMPTQEPHHLRDQAEMSETFSSAYVEAGLDNVMTHPVGYIAQRARNTLTAFLQPFGTAWFPGESIKVLVVEWLRGEATLDSVVRTDGFFFKLLIYLFHFTSVGMGLLGLCLSWRRWREVLPLALMLAYGTAVYAVLIILPRYLFPLMPFFWVAAGYGLVYLWAFVTRRKANAGMTVHS